MLLRIIFLKSSYRCHQIGWGHACLGNATFPIRFFEIEAIATDIAGNVGTASRKVIIADGSRFKVKSQKDSDDKGQYNIGTLQISSVGDPELVLVQELEHQSDRYLVDTYQVMVSPSVGD